MSDPPGLRSDITRPIGDDRLARIEAMLQTLPTKADLASLRAEISADLAEQIAGLRASMLADLIEQITGLTLALRRTEARLSSEIAVLEPLITRTDQRLTARVEALEAKQE